MKRFLSIFLLGSMFYFQHAESQCEQKVCPRCGRCQTCAVPQPSTAYYRWHQQCYWRGYCAKERGWYDTMEYPSYRSWKLWNQLTR